MIEPAYPYKEELNKIYARVVSSEFYKYSSHHSGYHSFQLDIKDNTWNDLEYVSMTKGRHIIGFMRAKICRIENYVNQLLILRFRDRGEHLDHIWVSDIKTFVRSMFDTHHFNKINFSVVVGSPYEQNYDRLVQRMGGRVVGFFEDDVQLSDGKLYGHKFYEIMQPAYAAKCGGGEPMKRLKRIACYGEFPVHLFNYRKHIDYSKYKKVPSTARLKYVGHGVTIHGNYFVFEDSTFESLFPKDPIPTDIDGSINSYFVLEGLDGFAERESWKDFYAEHASPNGTDRLLEKKAGRCKTLAVGADFFVSALQGLDWLSKVELPPEIPEDATLTDYWMFDDSRFAFLFSFYHRDFPEVNEYACDQPVIGIEDQEAEISQYIDYTPGQILGPVKIPEESFLPLHAPVSAERYTKKLKWLADKIKDMSESNPTLPEAEKAGWVKTETQPTEIIPSAEFKSVTEKQADNSFDKFFDDMPKVGQEKE